MGRVSLGCELRQIIYVSPLHFQRFVTTRLAPALGLLSGLVYTVVVLGLAKQNGEF